MESSTRRILAMAKRSAERFDSAFPADHFQGGFRGNFQHLQNFPDGHQRGKTGIGGGFSIAFLLNVGQVGEHDVDQFQTEIIIGSAKRIVEHEEARFEKKRQIVVCAVAAGKPDRQVHLSDRMSSRFRFEFKRRNHFDSAFDFFKHSRGLFFRHDSPSPYDVSALFDRLFQRPSSPAEDRSRHPFSPLRSGADRPDGRSA